MCDVTCKYTSMFKVASDKLVRMSNPHGVENNLELFVKLSFVNEYEKE